MIKPGCFGTKEYSKSHCICFSCFFYEGCGLKQKERRK